VAISDPATAHFTAYKNLGNTSIAYKPRHMHNHTHPETLEAREKKPRWQLVTQLLTDHNMQGGPKYQYKIHTNTICSIGDTVFAKYGIGQHTGRLGFNPSELLPG
jgi:hypothetical protein